MNQSLGKMGLVIQIILFPQKRDLVGLRKLFLEEVTSRLVGGIIRLTGVPIGKTVMQILLGNGNGRAHGRRGVSETKVVGPALCTVWHTAIGLGEILQEVDARKCCICKSSA